MFSLLLALAVGFAPEGVLTDFNGNKVTVYTSFELLNDIAADQPDVTVGIARFYNGGVVGTRGFKPGYRSGAFVWITPTVSQIDFALPQNKVEFWAKDIAELNGGADVGGQLIVFYKNGKVRTFDVPEQFTKFRFSNVTTIIVDSSATPGVPTNIDDFQVTFEDTTF